MERGSRVTLPAREQHDLDQKEAARLLRATTFNLIRRGADGSLALSADKWRLVKADSDTFCFQALAPEAPPLSLSLVDVEQIVWDRLAGQQKRSQVRFVFTTGDVWTFSGHLGSPKSGE